MKSLITYISEYKYTKEWIKVKNTDDLVVDCNYNTSEFLS